MVCGEKSGMPFALCFSNIGNGESVNLDLVPLERALSSASSEDSMNIRKTTLVPITKELWILVRML